MSARQPQAQPVLFVDFDGTVTTRDVVDVILEKFADERWLEIEKQWRRGRIGSRDCLRAQMALVRATRGELDALLDSIRVDEGFALLLEICARHQLAVHILSDGFDYCIRRILERPPLRLDRLLRNVLGDVRAGSVILLHDGDSQLRRDRIETVNSLPLIIEGLRRRGLKVVPLSELLA